MASTSAEGRGSLRRLQRHWFRFAQRLSQSLLLPIAILPAAGVMIGLATHPLPLVPDVVNALLLSLGGLIFDIMPMLFAIAVAIGFCQDQGIAAFSASFGYGILLSTLAAFAQIYQLPTQSIWGMATVDTGIAGGMLVGGLTCIAVRLSERMHLPSVWSFFAGRRSAPLILIPLVILLAILLAVIWPPLATEIEQFSNWAIYQKPAIAFGLYGLVERLLLPLGLHHIWNAPFFLELGQYVSHGEVVRGEIARYLAGDPKAGHLAGGYLIKMWGLPAAALAIWRSADETQRNRVAGVMLSAAAATWLTGVTEPVEFAFLFVAPLLYLCHALLTGLAYSVAILLDIHHSVVFSHGLLDFVLLYPQSHNTHWLWLLGPLSFILYYLLFRFSIQLFNLKTPGRLEADTGQIRSLFALVSALGGRGNIAELSACMTRLRIGVHEPALLDRAQLLSLGAKGVVVVGSGVQLVYGSKADTLRKLLQRYLESRR